ncbi:MAG: phosphatase PAP2 family protein [Paludibacteraceae bacterium]|nr:phosphatase PAP2 family protein [Paludibacteraceae bacterium]
MNIDADILLWINGHHCAWLDSVMWWISHPRTWLPLYVLLIGIVAYRFRSWKLALLIIAGFIVAVGMSDIFCSGILKPLVCRLRPTREPALDPLHLVNGYVGGRYGFCSSHAANTMTIATLFSLLCRNKYATAGLMVWVALNCYSRMYLGAHYPSDIIAGLLIGALWAVLVFLVLRHWLPEDGEATQRGGS